MPTYIDTHSHIYSEEFDKDRESVMQNAISAGVKHIILPDIDIKTRERMLQMEQMYPNQTTALLGVHPTSVCETIGDELKDIEKRLSQREFAGIGEIGLDYYWDSSTRDEQIKAFEYQLGLAQDMHIPVVIHSRKSLDDIFVSLKRFKGVTGILHCFPGDTNQAKRAIDNGFLLGVGGVVTFKNAHLAQVVKEVGYTNIVLETDSPYLTPSPHRGERNESRYIPIIADFISNLLDVSTEQIANCTTKNAVDMFNLKM